MWCAAIFWVLDKLIGWYQLSISYDIINNNNWWHKNEIDKIMIVIKLMVRRIMIFLTIMKKITVTIMEMMMQIMKISQKWEKRHQFELALFVLWFIIITVFHVSHNRQFYSIWKRIDIFHGMAILKLQHCMNKFKPPSNQNGQGLVVGPHL